MGKSQKRSRPKEFWNSLVSRNKPMTDSVAKALTPDEFRVFATERKWRREVIEELLKPPVVSRPFFIGTEHDLGGRQLVVIKDTK